MQDIQLSSKSVFTTEKVKILFFATFKIIINYIFPEDLIEIYQVFQKI